MMYRACATFFCALFLVGQFFTPVLAIGEDDPLWNKPSYEKKVYQIGRKLLDANHIDEEISFSVQYRTGGEKSNVNAYANDRYNSISIESGLLKYIDSDDELAYVLGHEIGHILRKHGSRGQYANLARSMLITAPITVLTMGYGAPVGVLLSQGLNNLASQGQESEADRIGFNLMVNAGYDPTHSIQMARKLYGDGTRIKFKRTHPKGKERIGQLKQMLAVWQQQQIAEKTKLETENTQKAPITAGEAVLSVSKGKNSEKTPDTAKPKYDDPDDQKYSRVPDLGENETSFDP